MQKYKRLLDKVTNKIDKWHDGKKNGEQFVKDDDFIEVERSPTHFSSTSDEDGVDNEEIQAFEYKSIMDSPMGMKMKFKTATSDQVSPSLRLRPPPDFKLNIMDTVAKKKTDNYDYDQEI